MARKKRNWFPGAKYHITCRGNRKAPLFEERIDRLKYFAFLEQARHVFPFRLHAYCLMTNHVHLSIETFDHPPGEIMKVLNSNYARYFNDKYEYSGHVFQGRYSAELLDSMLYEIDVSKYIHLNPVKAHMVVKPEDYAWSSYRAYFSYKKDSHAYPDYILSLFEKPAREAYRRYMHSSDPLAPPELKKQLPTFSGKRIYLLTNLPEW
ncbi:transposase [Guptibacillus hwajinpoensis]|uniref:REP element-mobilizing transposase RayT n=1 Tax=Guptibacillus hwajinpoensis TaxID=208199 RepID=A0ABU0K1T1_9BACL|nr:transposase [Alkalihalobacillus hemicentroti]MDQ0482378.1 REP element-mobilizing transposase RayT [Alkalihalobacillus hemicentroti]